MDAIGHFPELIDETAFVAPTASVIGKVTLGPGTSVWFGAVLRGDTDHIEICEGTNIQDNAVVHTDPGLHVRIGPNVTVGHGAILHGCTIEQGALIGMGATVLNGARIGAGAVIGAGALVSPGKEIPAGCLAMGVPARVVRELDEHGRASGAVGAAKYRRRAQDYKAYFEKPDTDKTNSRKGAETPR